MVDHAVRAGKSGRRIFPCHATDKRPHINEYHDVASTDEAHIRAWWKKWPNALIGNALEYDEIVLDVDPRHNGDQTWEALGGDDIPVTRKHYSGRGDGGAHYWFKRPFDAPLSVVKLNEWAKAMGVGEQLYDKITGEPSVWVSGIDVLHSKHRYTILPPSPHPDTGKPYYWDVTGKTLGEMPEHISTLLIEPPKPVRKPLKELMPIAASGVDEGETPADWYSRTADWNDVLEARGWQVVSGDGDEDGSAWAHPNATAPS